MPANTAGVSVATQLSNMRIVAVSDGPGQPYRPVNEDGTLSPAAPASSASPPPSVQPPPPVQPPASWAPPIVQARPMPQIQAVSQPQPQTQSQTQSQPPAESQLPPPIPAAYTTWVENGRATVTMTKAVRIVPTPGYPAILTPGYEGDDGPSLTWVQTGLLNQWKLGEFEDNMSPTGFSERVWVDQEEISTKEDNDIETRLRAARRKGGGGCLVM